MTSDLELEALKGALGLSHITDAAELRREVEKRTNAMSSFDRAALAMDIGGRVSEAEARQPGERFSPPSWTLIVTAAACLAGSALLALFAVRQDAVLLRVEFGVIALVLSIMTWRATARVLYRRTNDRDW